MRTFTYLILLITAIFGCQASGKKEFTDNPNLTDQRSQGIKENIKNISWEIIKELCEKDNLTFDKYVHSIPEASFPISHNKYLDLIDKIKNENSLTYYYSIDIDKTATYPKITTSKYDFTNIKKGILIEEIKNDEKCESGPNGGNNIVELNYVIPLFKVRKDNFFLIGYLAEWWTKSFGGDFYNKRVEIDLVCYNAQGDLVIENINQVENYPYYKLLAFLPDPDGYRLISASISDSLIIDVTEQIYSYFETITSENGLDESYLKLEEPKISSLEYFYTILDNGIIEEVEN